ncbi:MAG: serine/threonine-protein phosphatase, partial [Desulfobacterales bacterium]|nr:serine/threonine-protein phosphatase [Desulfobacterales bacterium]
MNLLTVSLSKPGGRKENQDYCGYKTINSITCYVMADGLGGHKGGAIASKIAVETILKSFESTPELSVTAIERYIESAQTAILSQQEIEPKLFNMRTTILVFIVDQTRALWAHIGDTRLYHFSKGSIVFQTKDHSLPQAMADAGKIDISEIRHHDDRNRLLRSLGNAENFSIS